MRTKKSYSYLGLFSIILLISVGLFFYLPVQQKKAAAKNLENFYNLTLKDPLFYSPFFDQKNFEEAVSGLTRSEERFKTVLIKNLKSGIGNTKDWYVPMLEKTSLYPYQFLRNLVSVNLKTEEFKKAPSIELGQSLLDLYDSTADSYLQGISSSIEAIELAQKNTKGKESYFFFVDSATSVDITKNNFTAIQKNGYALKEDIRKRRNCLFGKKPCQVPQEKISNTAFINSLNNKDNLAGKKIDFIKNNLPYSGQSEVKGPYSINSTCWQNPNNQHWLYLILAQIDNRTAAIPKLINQNYYYQVPSLAKSETDKIMLAKNVKFNLQPEANTYECTDLTFYPQILTMDFIANQLNEKKITEDDLTNNLDYQLLIENQFGLIAPAINTVTAHLKTLRLYMSTNKGYASPEYLFSVRSAYSILYFPFAKSIWRSKEQLQYLVTKEKTPLGQEEKFMTLDELEKLGYTEEEIARFHIGISDILEDLPENQP